MNILNKIWGIEMKPYFSKYNLYGDGIGYVTNEVSSVQPYDANDSEDDRINFVTELAAISRGKYESKNPKLRFEALMKETVNNGPSRPLEFLPVVVELKLEKIDGDCFPKLILEHIECLCKDIVRLSNNLLRYGYVKQFIDSGDKFENRTFLFTNMRALLNFGILYNNIPYSGDLKELYYKHFKVIRAKVPMFVWSQIMTHTQLSKVSQSDRVSKSTDYWLPCDLLSKIKNVDKNVLAKYKLFQNTFIDNITREMVLSEFLISLPQEQVQNFLKELGYQREIYSRAPYYFKYKEFIMSGWLCDTNGWLNMLTERDGIGTEERSWTQKETREFARAVAKILYKKKD